MGDTWALGMAGLQPASDYLELAAATPVDADPQIWGVIAGSLGGLHDYYRGDAAGQARLDAFGIATLAPVFKRVGWEAPADEAAPMAILRTQLIGTLAELGDASVVAEARRRYAARDSDPQAMPAALRKTILAVVAMSRLGGGFAASRMPMPRHGTSCTRLQRARRPRWCAISCMGCCRARRIRRWPSVRSTWR